MQTELSIKFCNWQYIKKSKIHFIHLLLSSVKKEAFLYLWILNVPFIGLVSFGVTHVLWVWVLIYFNGWVVTLGCLWVCDSTWAFSLTCWFLGSSVVPRENGISVKGSPSSYLSYPEAGMICSWIEKLHGRSREMGKKNWAAIFLQFLWNLYQISK